MREMFVIVAMVICAVKKYGDGWSPVEIATNVGKFLETFAPCHTGEIPIVYRTILERYKMRNKVILNLADK